MADWFIKWLPRMKRHNACGAAAIASLEGLEVETAIEYFAGAGCQTKIVQAVHRPRRHFLFDSHEEACAHLRQEFGLPVEALDFEEASKLDLNSGITLVNLDYGDMTLLRLKNGYHAAAMDRVFARQPAALVVTDIMGGRFPLQRKRLGFTTFDEYVEAVGDWYFSVYGYGMRDCFHGGKPGSLVTGTAVFTLMPGYRETRIHPYIAADASPEHEPEREEEAEGLKQGHALPPEAEAEP